MHACRRHTHRHVVHRLRAHLWDEGHLEQHPHHAAQQLGCNVQQPLAPVLVPGEHRGQRDCGVEVPAAHVGGAVDQHRQGEAIAVGSHRLVCLAGGGVRGGWGCGAPQRTHAQQACRGLTSPPYSWNSSSPRNSAASAAYRRRWEASTSPASSCCERERRGAVARGGVGEALSRPPAPRTRTKQARSHACKRRGGRKQRVRPAAMPTLSCRTSGCLLQSTYARAFCAMNSMAAAGARGGRAGVPRASGSRSDGRATTRQATPLRWYYTQRVRQGEAAAVHKVWWGGGGAPFEVSPLGQRPRARALRCARSSLLLALLLVPRRGHPLLLQPPLLQLPGHPVSGRRRGEVTGPTQARGVLGAPPPAPPPAPPALTCRTACRR